MVDLSAVSHGHVVKNKSGTLARCGGPAICSHCQLEAELIDLRQVMEWYEDDDYDDAKLLAAIKDLFDTKGADQTKGGE